MNYSLVSDPWIPVIDLAGKQTQASLQTLFAEADRLGAVGGTPSQHIALMRLLVAVSQAALNGPADNSGWLACRSAIQTAATAYLDRWRRGFDLFGETPFLQVPGLRGTRAVPVDALDYSFAVDSRTTWRDNLATSGPRARSPAWVALNLLTHQCFAAAGLIASGEFNGGVTARSAAPGPALASVPLHTLLIGKTLLDSIWLNLIPYDRLKPLEVGQPLWERPPFDAEGVKMHAKSFMGRLVPMPRGIRIHQGQDGADAILEMNRIEAVRFPGLPTGREPYATIVQFKRKDEDDGLGYVGFSPDRHPWRDLGAILQLEGANRIGTMPPLQLLNIPPLMASKGFKDSDAALTLWAGGMAYDRGNVAKIVGQGQWLFSVPLELIGETALAVYSEGVSFADDMSRSLDRAVKRYDENLFKQALGGFWHSCALSHPQLISAAIGQLSPDEWRRTVVGHALRQHSLLCRPVTTVQWKKFFVGQSIIKKGANK